MGVFIYGAYIRKGHTPNQVLPVRNVYTNYNRNAYAPIIMHHTIIRGRTDAATYVCSISTPREMGLAHHSNHTIIYHQFS